MDQSNKKRRPALELDFPIRSSDFSVVTNRRSDGFRASNNLVKVCELVSTELEARAELETGGYFLHALVFRGMPALGPFLYPGLPALGPFLDQGLSPRYNK